MNSARRQAKTILLLTMLGWFPFTCFAQYSFSQLRSFGFKSSSVINPKSTPTVIGFGSVVVGVTEQGGDFAKGVLYKIDLTGSRQSVLHHFQGYPSDGAYPSGPLVFIDSNRVAGVTYGGGSVGVGTLFTYNLATDTYSILHHFTGGETSGDSPEGTVVVVTTGDVTQLFGVTGRGGPARLGTLYRINADGTGYTTLRIFTGDLALGQPTGGLSLIGSVLFGTTSAGGVMNAGALFAINQDGSGFTTLVHFGGAQGNSPVGTVLSDHGFLLGATTYGGLYDKGLIYQIQPSGVGFRVLHDFQGGTYDGEFPGDGFIAGPDGRIYGTTPSGGFYNLGTLFRFINPGTNTIIPYEISTPFTTAGGGGTAPFTAPSKLSGVVSYGVTSQGGRYGNGILYRVRFLPGAPGYLNDWHFNETGGDGLSPTSPLLIGSDGFLYGVTPDGGSSAGGTVYRVTKAGTNTTTLRNFNLAPGDFGSVGNGDGRKPVGGLLEASDGFLYGVTQLGYGVSLSSTIFRLNKSGTTRSSLKYFNDGPFDGRELNSALIEGQDGLLYGTARLGGSADVGTLFRLQKNGTNFAVIRHWTGGVNDGAQPNGVIEGSDGWLYGITQAGGSNDLGLVFKLQRDGSGFMILHHFDLSEGGQPQAGLLEASDGHLYGTTSSGGSDGAGTVFKLTRTGDGFAVIKHFSSNDGDATSPACLLVEGSDRALYGTTAAGGTNGVGAVFRVTRDGSTASVIHSFNTLGVSGFGPVAGLVKDSDGVFYGVTEQGGDVGKGTLFKLTPPWTNHPPIVSKPIGGRVIAWAAETSFTFAPDVFTDSDPGQVLTYSAAGQPAGLNFTGTSRTFSGKALDLGNRTVTLVATDNGTPALSGMGKFNLNVIAVQPRLSANADSNGVASLSLQATNGQTVLLQFSTNLTSWRTLSTNFVLTSPLPLSDPASSNRPQSFYRAIIQP